MKIEITAHAAERYVERCAPAMSTTEALSLLEAHASKAVAKRETSPNGQRLFHLAELGCVLVVKHDRRTRTAVAVTTLPETTAASEVDLVEALAELEAARAELELEVPALQAKKEAAPKAVAKDVTRDLQALGFEIAIVKQHEKTIRTALTELRRDHSARRALRVAVAALQYGTGAALALEQIGEFDPHFVSEDFVRGDDP